MNNMKDFKYVSNLRYKFGSQYKRKLGWSLKCIKEYASVKLMYLKKRTLNVRKKKRVFQLNVCCSHVNKCCRTHQFIKNKLRYLKAHKTPLNASWVAIRVFELN